MSQLNVDTLGAQTGTTISLASGHTLAGVGLSEVDHWQLTSNLTASADPITTFVRPTGTLQAKVGTGMSVSSGVWTFPSTGFYRITVHAFFSNNSDNQDGDMIIYSSANNGTAWDEIAYTAYMGNSGDFAACTTSCLLDITDLSNHKVKFRFNDNQGGCNLLGESTKNRTMFEFIKVSET